MDCRKKTGYSVGHKKDKTFAETEVNWSLLSYIWMTKLQNKL